METQGQRLQVFKGSYTQFKAQKDRQREEQAEAEKLARLEASVHPKKTKTAAKHGKALSKYEQKKRQNRLVEIETELQALEKRQAEISSQLETPPDDPGEVLRLGEDYMKLQQKMESLMAEWSHIEEELSDE